MPFRPATSLTIVLLVGLQGPACLALCDMEGKAQAEPMAAHTPPACHDENASAAVSHPEPSDRGCPVDCSGCSDESPFLTANAKDASDATPVGLVLVVSLTPAPALDCCGQALRIRGQDPPPRDLLLVTTSLRL